MKQILFVLLLVLSPVLVRAYDFAIESGKGYKLYYTITDGIDHTVMVVPPTSSGTSPYKGQSSPSGSLIIPATVVYNNVAYTVTAIGERAFSGCFEITEVSIPSTVTSIGNYAFYLCTSISKPVVIGESVESIGNSVFYGCSQLPEVVYNAIDCHQMGGSTSTSVFGNCASLTKITIGPKVRSIPDYAFCGADNVNNNIVFPSGLQRIGSFAFAYCASLNGRIVIPRGVKSIGECAFHQCHTITGVDLPSDISIIGQRAFYQCLGLTDINCAAILPPTIFPSTFSNLSPNVSFIVPCMSLRLYRSAPEWNALSNYQTMGDCDFRVDAELSVPEAGTLVGAGRYGYSDTATLVIICKNGYGFVGWDDGNNDNPRKVIVSKNITLKARVQPTHTIYVHDTLRLVDTIYRDGVKIIHDTIDVSDVDLPISAVSILHQDPALGCIFFDPKNGEKIVRAYIYNDLGDCVISSRCRRNRLDISRLPKGSYVLKVETNNRIIRTRFFHSHKK